MVGCEPTLPCSASAEIPYANRPDGSNTSWATAGSAAVLLAPDVGGRFEGEIVSLDEDGGEAVVTLRPERGEARRIPLTAVKEARLAFRFQ